MTVLDDTAPETADVPGEPDLGSTRKRRNRRLVLWLSVTALAAGGLIVLLAPGAGAAGGCGGG
jgi:hypothetical protein